MDNSYSKGGNTNNQPEPVNTASIKMPKNIRQVGNIGSHNKVIYVEDYVMTYIKQLSEKEHSGCRITVLLGYYIRTEEGKNIFIKGAVEMMNTDFSNGISFSDEGWTSIYENIKKYFSDVEIVGWTLIGPEFFIEGGEKIRKIHMDNFSGPDKVLLKMDSMEKEEAFYLNENNQLVKQNGYYIYYEKNEEMQNYMVENKEAASEERNYNDRTIRKIRNVIQEKKEVKDDRSVIRLLYAASTLLAIIVLVIAATMLDNYDKMKNMESALNTISQNLNLVDNNGDGSQGDAEQPSGDDIQVADGKEENSDQVAESDQDGQKDTQTSEEKGQGDKTGASDTEDTDGGKDVTEVETIEGNISNEDANTPTGPEKNNEPEDNSDGNKDTTKAGDRENDNSENPEKAADASADDSVETSTQVKYYIVRAGDSLAAISYELYNTFSYMDEIKELNGIEDENKIYEGQKLIVP